MVIVDVLAEPDDLRGGWRRFKVLPRVWMVGCTPDITNGSNIGLDLEGLDSIKGSTWELSPKELQPFSRGQRLTPSQTSCAVVGA